MQLDSAPYHDGTMGFMLKEYERLQTLVLDEIKQTEQRINFFFTITSAVVGFIVILTQVSNVKSQSFTFAVVAMLVILLAVGFNIQSRINLNSVQLQNYGQMMYEIQDFFAKQDSDIATYLENARKRYQGPNRSSKLSTFIITRFRGSYNDLIGLINAFISGAIVMVILVNQGYPVETSIGWAIATSIIVLVGLYFSLRYVRQYLTSPLF